MEDPLIMPPIVEFTSEITREKEWDNIAAIHEGDCVKIVVLLKNNWFL